MANREVKINEFLCFVQNKIDILDDLSVVQICESNFKESVIENGKSELYGLIPESGRCILRKGEDKKKKDIKDVIKVLKETPTATQPIFVAQDLNLLPPVTFDYIDVTRLLKDIVILKTELQSLRNDTVSKSELKDFETKISADLQSMSSSVQQLDKQQCVLSPIPTPSQKNSPKRLRKGIISDSSDKEKLTQSQRSDGYPSHSRHSQPSQQHTEPVRVPSYRDIALLPSTSAMPTRAPLQANITRQDRNNMHEDSFTLVERKKRNKRNNNMNGTAQQPSKLQVAQLPAIIYVSRLMKTTTVDDIKEHIREMKEDCIQVELLKQNYETSFNSFKVIVDQLKLSTFLCSDFWPTGVKYRRFRDSVCGLR